MPLLNAHRVFRSSNISSYARKFIAIACTSSCLIAISQTSSAKKPGTDQNSSADIINRLAPDGVAPSTLALAPAQKAQIIRSLTIAKQQETGPRRQMAMYLLATLGQDYQINRNSLLKIWQGCAVKNHDLGCDENTGDMLIKLYKQGHKELLRPILAGSHYSDGALSEELYPFYVDRLDQNQQEFISALATFHPSEQSQICVQVGNEVCEQSGGGPTDGSYPALMQTLLTKLKKTDGEIANRCSRAIRQGYQNQQSAILQEEKGPQTP
jgi:hypothetical protein